MQLLGNTPCALKYSSEIIIHFINVNLFHNCENIFLSILLWENCFVVSQAEFCIRFVKYIPLLINYYRQRRVHKNQLQFSL